MIAFGIFTSAQSLNLTSTLPLNVPIGTTASFTMDYTSTVPCKIIVALIKSQADGTTPDWNSWQVGATLDNLPVSATPSSKTITVDVPVNQTLSADLPNGIKYLWALTLQDASGGWIAGSQPQTTIVASNTVTDNVSFHGTLPTSVSAGSTQNIPYKYTATTDRIIKIGLSKYSSSGNWLSDVVSEIVNPAVATTITPITGAASLTIPSDITPSTQLPNGEYYKWEATIATTSWGYIGGTTTNVGVTGSLSVSENKKKQIRFYPNPVKDVLNFATPSGIKSIRITDLSGRTILNETIGFENGLNLSQLPKGTYIVTINGTDTQKLIKE